MKIFFDHQAFTLQEYGGISRYVCALAMTISDIGTDEVRVSAPAHINRHLLQLRAPLVKGRYIRRSRGLAPILGLVNAALQPFMVAEMQPDVIHETFYSKFPFYRRRIPRILTVHDMIHEKFPEEFPPFDAKRNARKKKAALARADRIICVSQSTRRDLIELYPDVESKVTIVHNGYAEFIDAANAQSVRTPKPFLLYVGSRSGYKNFHVFAQAFSQSTRIRDNFRIICFGGPFFSAAEQRQHRALGLTERHITHVTGGDEVLEALYRSASALIYPSLYEGFGIPPLEAMSLACPVICSSIPASREVVEHAGEYFSPHDAESLMFALTRVVDSPSRRAELIAFGLEQCRKYSWTRCARETLAVYGSLL